MKKIKEIYSHPILKIILLLLILWIGSSIGILYLEDGELAIIRNHKETFFRKISDDSAISPTISKLELSLDKIEKQGFDHYMLKEIYEQPKAIKDTLRGR